jgi:hypothetical protein
MVVPRARPGQKSVASFNQRRVASGAPSRWFPSRALPDCLVRQYRPAGTFACPGIDDLFPGEKSRAHAGSRDRW